MTETTTIPTREELSQMFGELINKYSKDKTITLSEDTKLTELGVDSIDIMEIVFEIEELHGIEIDDVGTLDADNFGQLLDSVVQSFEASA